MSEFELTAKIRELKELEAYASEISAEIEGIKDLIKGVMADRETMTVDVYKLSYKTVKSSRLDTKRLKADAPELYEAYTVTSSTRRFSIA